MKVAASASHVEVAISLSKWPLARGLCRNWGGGAACLRGSPHRPGKCREAASTTPLKSVCRGDAAAFWRRRLGWMTERSVCLPVTGGVGATVLPACRGKRGIHRSVPALERDIRAWVADWNDHPRPSTWTWTADGILGTFAPPIR
jgi:hypothetical protein